ncbi:MAG: HD domain-containing protein [Eubacteriales bacterium]|nr:HD domain-containing protein [Eubacteriales bacterium]
MKYIENLKSGTQISEIYLCKSRTSALTKAGKPYDNVILQDKTGTIDAKIWDPDSAGIADFEELDYVEVTGDVNLFMGKNQLIIRRARIADADEYQIQDYIPVSAVDPSVMYKDLLGFIDSISNPYLKQLLESFFLDPEFGKLFMKHSAAKTMHHGYVGGLLEHTLSVTRFCDFLAERYSLLNRDLLLTAAMFHDIGKTREISPFPQNDYTDEGQLLGHIIIGVEMLDEHIREIDGFPVIIANELKHCILAHHGELEFGSPKKPALAEAFALATADNADAKLQMLTEVMEKTEEGNTTWLGFNRQFESNLRRTSEI